MRKAIALCCLTCSFLFAIGCIASLFHSARVFAAGLAASSGERTEGIQPYTLGYTKDGDLVPPVKQYREWIYLTSGLGMSYSAGNFDNPPSFDNVFVNPEAYRSFLANGTWPDKTVLVLEVRGSGSKSSINKSGHFQRGAVTGLEVHVKDEARFPGKWAFFDVASETKATLFAPTANCYSCHADHAAVDTTFTQFYPTLFPIAQKKGTLSEKYLKETDTEAKKQP